SMSMLAGTIDTGANTLSIGDVASPGAAAQYVAALEWKGGVIKGGASALKIGSRSSLSLQGASDILDAAVATNYGSAAFANNSTLTLKNTGSYVQASGTFSVAGYGTIAGPDGGPFQINSAATLNVINTSDEIPFAIVPAFLLDGTLNLNKGFM